MNPYNHRETSLYVSDSQHWTYYNLKERYFEMINDHPIRNIEKNFEEYPKHDLLVHRYLVDM